MLGTEVLVFLRCLAAKVLSVKTDPTNECKLLLILKEGVPVFVKASRIQFCEVCDSLYSKKITFKYLFFRGVFFKPFF